MPYTFSGGASTTADASAWICATCWVLLGYSPAYCPHATSTCSRLSCAKRRTTGRLWSYKSAYYARQEATGAPYPVCKLRRGGGILPCLQLCARHALGLIG